MQTASLLKPECLSAHISKKCFIIETKKFNTGYQGESILSTHIVAI